MLFKSRRAAPADEPPGDTFGYRRVVALEAVPDYATIHHSRALNYSIGLGLQGHTGQVIGYDRGDPATSLNAVMPPQSNPTLAMAHVGHLSDALSTAPPAEITDIVMTDPALDTYQEMLWNRITR